MNDRKPNLGRAAGQFGTILIVGGLILLVLWLTGVIG